MHDGAIVKFLYTLLILPISSRPLILIRKLKGHWCEVQKRSAHFLLCLAGHLAYLMNIRIGLLAQHCSGTSKHEVLIRNAIASGPVSVGVCPPTFGACVGYLSVAMATYLTRSILRDEGLILVHGLTRAVAHRRREGSRSVRW